jgi:peroxiredoxin
MLAMLVAFSISSPALANTPASVGAPAPDFSLSDLDGKAVKLSDYKGKTVVLEWFNPGCPFVKYAHAGGPLDDLAAKRTSDEMVWLAINSSAPEKQGHGVETNREAAKSWKISHPILLDEDGTVGRLYGAKTTPQMFIVDAKGTLIYGGALDNSPMGKSTGSAANYIVDALDAVAAGSPIKISETKPYGCSVKY